MMRLNVRIFIGNAAVVLPVLLAAWLMDVPPSTLTGLALIALMTTLLVSFIVARMLGHSLREVSRAAHEVGEGNYEMARLLNLPVDFIGLSSTFNRMVEALRVRDAEFHVLHNELSRRVRELNALYEVSRSVNSSLDVQEVLRTILNETVRTFAHSRKAIIHMVDESGERLVPYALSDSSRRSLDAMSMPLNKGIAGYVVRKRRPLTIPDTTQDARFIDLGSNVRSLMVTPLEIGDNVIGALSLDSERRNAFTQDMEVVFRSLGNRAAMALENARLYSESQKRVAEFTALYHSALELSGEQREGPLADRLVQLAVTMLEADSGILFLTHPEHDMWNAVASLNVAGNAMERHQRVAEQVFQSGAPHIENPAGFRSELFRHVPAQDKQEESLIAVPLLWEHRVQGVLQVCRATSRRRFSQSGVRLLTLFAQQATSAIQNERLFRAAQSRAEQLAKILEVIEDLRQHQALEAVLQKITEVVRSTLGWRTVALVMRDQEQGASATVAVASDDESTRARLLAIPPRPRAREPWEDSRFRISQSYFVRAEDRLSWPAEGGRPGMTRAVRYNPWEWQPADTLIIPIVGSSGVLGHLSVDDPVDRRRPTLEQIQVLEIFAHQAASAIQDARLIDELQSKTRALQELNKDLARASQLKSEFLANMSHELRTPLNSILGFSEILLDETFGELNERQMRYMSNIHRSGQHLLDLINDILDLSRIEAGRMELSRESFLLREALYEIQTVIEPLAARRELSLSFDSSQAPERIIADRLRFKQVLYNLVANAVKFTPEGGSVQVRAWEDKDTVYLSVSDTGIGIPPEQLENIFNVFHRLDRAYRSETEGTGLGLALVRRFMELHGGDVSVTSEVGVGSTFTIALPQREVVAGEQLEVPA